MIEKQKIFQEQVRAMDTKKIKNALLERFMKTLISTNSGV